LKEPPVKSLPVILSVLPLLGACATDPYGNNVEARTMGGALAGAAIGALGGQLIGVYPVTGAAAGLVVGGTAGYVTKNVGGHQRRYYKDASGYCYYVDANGLSHYDDPPVRC
jgi:uncharacterized membrane protein